jgi:hypothetical protein
MREGRERWRRWGACSPDGSLQQAALQLSSVLEDVAGGAEDAGWAVSGGGWTQIDGRRLACAQESADRMRRGGSTQRRPALREVEAAAAAARPRDQGGDRGPSRRLRRVRDAITVEGGVFRR